MSFLFAWFRGLRSDTADANAARARRKLIKYESTLKSELKRWEPIPAQRVADIAAARVNGRKRILAVHGRGLVRSLHSKLELPGTRVARPLVQDDLIPLFAQHATLLIKLEYLRAIVDAAAVEILVDKLTQAQAIRRTLDRVAASVSAVGLPKPSRKPPADLPTSPAPPLSGQDPGAVSSEDHAIMRSICEPGRVDAFAVDPSEAVATAPSIVRLQVRNLLLALLDAPPHWAVRACSGVWRACEPRRDSWSALWIRCGRGSTCLDVKSGACC